MEKSEIKQSLKNIPIPSNEPDQLNLIDKIESLVDCMRWRGILLCKPTKCDNNVKETFDFKLRKCPPLCPDLIPFEKDLSDMVT